MNMEERACRVALAACSGLERMTMFRLMAALGSATAVWGADVNTLARACRMHKTTLERLNRWRNRCQPFELEAALMDQGIQCVVQGDEDYPESLYDLAHPPIVLFGKGLFHTFENTVSIVGTRRMSAYGREAAHWIAETLAAHGCHVVSGLAEGIDGIAHQAALMANGKTTAVLGCGVHVCYPRQHTRLYRQIVEADGLIMSEYPPGDPVAKHRFPERNRLIAALSKTLIIVQAGEKSGALRTVDAALEIGRDVYVVPGPITASLHRGSNRLLQQGASVLLDPMDFLLEQGYTLESRTEEIPERWQELYESLLEPMAPLQLALQIAKPVTEVYAALLELELGGFVERQPGGTYVRKNTNHRMFTEQAGLQKKSVR